MKRKLFGLVSLLLTAGLFFSGCAGTNTHGLDKNNPVTITVWHYYNGPQKQQFDEMVSKFNETEGAEKGVIVEAYSQGNVNDLIEKVLDAANHKVGADEVPNIFAAYADTAYKVDQMGLLADIGAYLTDEQKEAFVPAYLEEGKFGDSGESKIFPVAKSTEVFMINQTAWEEFAAATGASEESFKTWEGLAKVAEQYYEWTDAKTPAKDDGKAFFGRDSFANYMLIGSRQLGKELFSVQNGQVTYQLDEAILRRLWDNYYVPYINGYFADFGKFRTDDVKTGDIVSLVGSTSGSTYFPTEVTNADGSKAPITAKVYAVPNFANTDPVAVQQGAGMSITKSDEAREYASALFLTWFTSEQRNTEFCINSGYLPVTTAQNNAEALDAAIKNSGESLPDALKDTLYVGVETVQSYELYTNKAFSDGNQARSIVDRSMAQKAKDDRKAVQTLMKNGLSRKDAVARYNTDENFQAWVQAFSDELQGLSK